MTNLFKTPDIRISQSHESHGNPSLDAKYNELEKTLHGLTDLGPSYRWLSSIQVSPHGSTHAGRPSSSACKRT